MKETQFMSSRWLLAAGMVMGLTCAQARAEKYPDMTKTGPDYDFSRPATKNFAPFNPLQIDSSLLVQPEAPQIAEWTRNNEPGDTMALTGEKLSSFAGSDEGRDTRFVIYGEGRPEKDGLIQRLDGQQCALTLSIDLPPDEMYLMWPHNDSGYGEPVRINGTELWWANDYVEKGGSFRVFGQNLTLGSTTSYLYIEELDTWRTNTSANPYMAEYTLPASATAGTYTIYAHNGHGREYGWSEPLSITVWNGFQFSDDTNTWYDVTDYGLVLDGVTDNSAALRSLWNTVRNDPWPTIYFPAGTNFLGGTTANTFSGGTCNGVRFIGDGTNSVQKTQVDAYRGYAFNFAKDNTVVKDLLILKQQIETSAYCPVVLVRANNVLFDSVVFDDRSVAADSPGTYMALESFGSHHYYTNCTWICDKSLFVGGTDFIFEDCTFKGIWDNNGLLYAETDEMALINCAASSYDNSDAGHGTGWAKGRWVVSHGETANWYIGGCVGTNLYPRKPTPNYIAIPTRVDPPVYYETREVNGKPVAFSIQTLYFEDIPDSASRSHKIVVEPPNTSGYRIHELNTTEDYVVIIYESWVYDGYQDHAMSKFDNWEIGFIEDMDWNSGEVFLKESGSTDYRGSPNEWSSNTVSFANLSSYLTKSSSGQSAVIVGGRGLGQSRFISSIASGTVTLEKNWRVVPDETSVITIGEYAKNWAITDNYIHSDTSAFVLADNIECASGGVQFSAGGGAHSVVIDGNTFDGTGKGVMLEIASWSGFTKETNTVSPWYFGRISGNTFLDNNYGILENSGSKSGTTPNYDDPMVLGMVVRGNTISGSKEYALGSGYTYGNPIDSGSLTVWEGNLVTNLVGVLQKATHARDNDVWINNTFYGSGSGIRLFGKPVAMRGNTFHGFTSNYWGILPGAILEVPVRWVNLAKQSSVTIPVWQSGTSSVDIWTVSETSSWFDVSKTSEPISADSGAGSITLNLLFSPADDAREIITISAAGQTKKITVVYEGSESNTIDGAADRDFDLTNYGDSPLRATLKDMTADNILWTKTGLENVETLTIYAYEMTYGHQYQLNIEQWDGTVWIPVNATTDQKPFTFVNKQPVTSF